MSRASDEADVPGPVAHDEPIAPVSLRIVGYLFILVGVLAATHVVVSAIKDELSLDLGVFGIFIIFIIFIGRGILCGRKAWQGCATAALGLMLFSVFIVFSVESVVLADHVAEGKVGDEFSFPAVALAIVTAAVACWALRVLRSPAAQAWFAESTRRPERRRFQFSLQTLLFLMLLCSLVLARITTDEQLFYVHCETGTNKSLAGGGFAEAAWRYRRHRLLQRPEILDYVFFSIRTEFVKTKTGWYSGGRGASGFVETEGVRISLPSRYQLHEIIDGRHLTTDRRVAMEELQAYLDSNPQQYSIQGLLDFVDARAAERD